MTQDQQKAVFFQGGASPVTDLCVVLHNNKALQVVELCCVYPGWTKPVGVSQQKKALWSLTPV